MPLVVRDGNGAAANLPNAGVDTVYYASDNTVTTTFTNATDVYQFVGAASTVGRIRKIEAQPAALYAASTTFAGSSTLVRLLRRSTAGTTGTWSAIAAPATYQGATSAGASSFAAAAPATTLNVAGTTAFTVGTPKGFLRAGYVVGSNAPAAGLNLNHSPMTWLFGVNGNAPLSYTGTSDFIVVNLNAVTPIALLWFNFEWEEATF